MAETSFEAVRDVCKRTQRRSKDAAMRQIVLHGMRPRFEFLPGSRFECTSRAISRGRAPLAQQRRQRAPPPAASPAGAHPSEV